MLSSRNRRRLFRAGFATLSGLKADRWLAPVSRGAGIILTFHHVRLPETSDYAPNALLSITPAFLERTLVWLKNTGFELISLDDVPGRLSDTEAAMPFAALTFDDGYRDNVQYAAPVLARYDAPWTLFVTSDFADGNGRLWWIELERAIGRLERIRLPHAGIDLPTRDADEKNAAFDAVYRHLRAGPEAVLLQSIAALCREAGIVVGDTARELCLTWNELRDLSRDPRVTFGAHTLSHPMLAKHDSAFVTREIAGSAERLAAELGRPVRHLSYPVGDPGSAGLREFAIARQLGFATSVTTRPGHVFDEHANHLHALPRVSINGLYQDEAALRSLFSGVPFLAWNRGRRLNVA